MTQPPRALQLTFPNPMPQHFGQVPPPSPALPSHPCTHRLMVTLCDHAVRLGR
jgi:hypothetical protein